MAIVQPFSRSLGPSSPACQLCRLIPWIVTPRRHDCGHRRCRHRRQHNQTGAGGNEDVASLFLQLGLLLRPPAILKHRRVIGHPILLFYWTCRFCLPHQTSHLVSSSPRLSLTGLLFYIRAWCNGPSCFPSLVPGVLTD